jgi:hypothetical protein
MASVEVDAAARAETLTLDDFARLAGLLGGRPASAG